MCIFSGPSDSSITKGITPKKTSGRTPRKASFADVLKKGLMKRGVSLSRSQRAHHQVLQRAKVARAARTTTTKSTATVEKAAAVAQTKFDMVRIYYAYTTQYGCLIIIDTKIKSCEVV